MKTQSDKRETGDACLRVQPQAKPAGAAGLHNREQHPSDPSQNRTAPKRRREYGQRLARRFWPLESGHLSSLAQTRTGLADFGAPELEPALSMLTRSLDTEGCLHPRGRFLMHCHLRGLLETRLRLIELWRNQAGRLSEEPIESPIFVMGMPRSGSTFLHELLSEDPAHRAPRVWEVMFPIGHGQTGERRRDLRVWRAEMCLWWFRRFAPQADAVFPMRAKTPHECVAIQSYSFLSEEFVSTCRVPSYETFLHSTDRRPAYDWERRFLQHLQVGSPRRRWVLKSPDHVHALRELFAVFPDALIIQTHRNPLEVVKSSCQLTHVLMGLYGRAPEAQAIAARELAMVAASVQKFIDFRDRFPHLAHRFVDVKYKDLVGNPLAVLRRIYRQFELPLSEMALERMSRLARERSRYHKPRKLRALAELKLHAAAEFARFERYCARFGIAWQTPVA